MTPHQYRNRVERKRLKLERRYIALLEKVFNKQLNDFTRAIDENLYGAVYSIDVYFNDKLLERALVKLWEETGEEFRIDNMEAILVKSINQETWVSLMSNWIARTGAEKIKTINGFTKEFVQRKLRPVLTDGVQQGLGIPKISRNIIENVQEYQGAFSKYRASRVARTEIVGMSNRSSFMSAESAGMENTMQKFWIVSMDGKERDTHGAMDGKPAIPMQEPFIVGGEELMYPGDPNGGPSETINCRCVIGYRRIAPTVQAQQRIQEVQDVQDVNVFIPAKTLEEADERLSAFGKVNIKNIPLDDKNQILQSAEEILGQMPDKKLIEGFIYQKDNKRSIGSAVVRASDFDDSYTDIVSIRYKKTFLKDPQKYTNEQKEVFKNSITYRKSEVDRFLKIPNLPDDVIQRKLETLNELNTYKNWAVYEASSRPVYTVATHEHGHALYKIKGLKNKWSDNLKKNNVSVVDKRLVSEYGASDIEELFCETLAAYKSSVPIPDNIVKALLETIN